MKAKGNGSAQQCVANLLNLFQYEVPFARMKGMDPTIIDLPTGEAEIAAKNHASWLIETYEPRAIVNDISVTYTDENRMILNPDITISEA